MTLTRLMVLTVGPPLLVGAAYALSFPSPKSGESARGAHLAEAEARAARAFAGRRNELGEACAAVADELLPNLPPASRVIVRPPFILAGDLSEDELDRLFREAILPVTAALWRSYYDRKPDKPVTIVALANAASYRAAASSLDDYEPLAYAGYTKRDRRRIVFNLSTGRGTLAHELAHVLAAFDFPGMPEWFDEGLAALHEEASFSGDGLTMVGSSNWRSRLLHEALREGQLPALETVIKSPEFRGEGEGLNYAVVRCFCQYLQERDLASHFYRKFRDAVEDDPSGISTLCALLGVATIDDVDRDFRAWALTK